MSVVSNDLGARLQQLTSERGWMFHVSQGAKDSWWVHLDIPGQATEPIRRQSFRSEGTPEGAAENAIAWMEANIATS